MGIHISVKLSMLALYNIGHSYYGNLLNLFMMWHLCTVGEFKDCCGTLTLEFPDTWCIFI